MSLYKCNVIPEELEPPALPTPKPREITITLDQGEMVISRSPRQRWVDMCWQLLGMQRDIAQRQAHGPGSTKMGM